MEKDEKLEKGIEEAMLQVLPEEAHIIPGEHSMAGLAFAAGTAETTERTTYANSSTERIRAGLQDGEPPYLKSSVKTMMTWTRKTRSPMMLSMTANAEVRDKLLKLWWFQSRIASGHLACL